MQPTNHPSTDRAAAAVCIEMMFHHHGGLRTLRHFIATWGHSLVFQQLHTVVSKKTQAVSGVVAEASSWGWCFGQKVRNGVLLTFLHFPLSWSTGRWTCTCLGWHHYTQGIRVCFPIYLQFVPRSSSCALSNDSQPHVSEVSPEHALEDVLNSALQSRQTRESQKAWATAPKMALAAQKSCVQDAPLECLFPVNDHEQRKLFQGFQWLLFLSTWHQPSNAVAVSWRAPAQATYQRKRRERNENLAFWCVLHSCLVPFLLSPLACFLLSLS